MDAGSILPEEFRKLEMKIEILQWFLTKSFGSTFDDFYKEKELTFTINGSTSSSTPSVSLVNKPLTSLNTQQEQMDESSFSVSSASAVTTQIVRTEPPILTGNSRNNKPSGPTLTILTTTGEATATLVVKAETENLESQAVLEDYYEDSKNVVQLLQSEKSVFSEPSQHQLPYHSAEDHQQGQHENYASHQQEGNEIHSNAATDVIDGDGKEYYDEIEPLGFSMVDDEEELEEDEDADDHGAVRNNTSDKNLLYIKDGNAKACFGKVVIETDKGTRNFQCSICPDEKLFRHKQSLKEHYLLQHSLNGRLFQCSQCERRFLKPSQLKRHEIVHTRSRLFVCEICQKQFSRKDNMNAHMLQNHAEKQHKCPHCPDDKIFYYATQTEFKRHLKKAHVQLKGKSQKDSYTDCLSTPQCSSSAMNDFLLEKC